MPKKLTYEERFERFKKRYQLGALQQFLYDYQEFKEIEQGLIKEKMEQFKK